MELLCFLIDLQACLQAGYENNDLWTDFDLPWNSKRALRHVQIRGLNNQFRPFRRHSYHLPFVALGWGDPWCNVQNHVLPSKGSLVQGGYCNHGVANPPTCHWNEIFHFLRPPLLETMKMFNWKFWRAHPQTSKLPQSYGKSQFTLSSYFITAARWPTKFQW